MLALTIERGYRCCTHLYVPGRRVEAVDAVVAHDGAVAVDHVVARQTQLEVVVVGAAQRRIEAAEDLNYVPAEHRARRRSHDHLSR